MGRLHAGRPRNPAGDPLVNGYTRRASGFIFRAPSSGGTEMGAGSRVSVVKRVNLTSAYVQSGGVEVTNQGFYMTTSGVELANADGTAGAWVGLVREDNARSYGAAGAALGPLLNAGGSAFAIEYYNGQVKVWADGQLLGSAAYNYTQTGGKFSVVTFCSASGNPDSGPTAHKMATIAGALITRRRDIDLVGLPSGGYVLATVGNQAAVRADVDGDGNGTLLVPGNTNYPCKIVYDIRRSDDTRAALLTVPESWGGDVIGAKTLWQPPAGPFSPLSLQSCQLWLAPEKITGSAGSDVLAWQDSTANARTFAKHASLGAPVVAPAQINGRNLVRFDGAARSLQRADAALRSRGATWAFVFKWNALATGGAFSLCPSANDGFNVNYNGSGRALTAYNPGFDYRQVNNNDTALHLVVLRFSASSAILQTYLDGVQQYSGGGIPAWGSSPNASLGTFYAGQDMAAPAIHGQFDFGEMVMCNKALSDADLAQLTSYLKARWGIL